MNRNRSRTNAIVAAQNLRALLACDYEDFVECAYLTILNRPADADGLAHSLERLRVGHPKLAILSSLYGSEEARSVNVQIPWLRGALFRYQFTKLPVINRIFHRVNQNAIHLQFEHRIHLLEQRVAVLMNQNAAVTTEIELLTRGAGKPNEDSETVSNNPARELSGKSVVAKRVYNELAEAISERREEPRRPS